MMDIVIVDDFLDYPALTMSRIAGSEFGTIAASGIQFHGIAHAPLDVGLPARIAQDFPEAIPTLSIFRKSPEGQVEPNYIHSDCEMGDWTAILYLNENPPPGDGTDFWFNEKHQAKGTAIPGDLLEEGRTRDGWTMTQHIEAKFNRLLVFPSQLFHSRAIFENYGQGDTARLTQVAFGRFA